MGPCKIVSWLFCLASVTGLLALDGISLFPRPPAHAEIFLPTNAFLGVWWYILLIVLWSLEILMSCLLLGQSLICPIEDESNANGSIVQALYTIDQFALMAVTFIGCVAEDNVLGLLPGIVAPGLRYAILGIVLTSADGCVCPDEPASDSGDNDSNERSELLVIPAVVIV